MTTAIKENIEGNTIRVGVYDTPLTPMDGSSRQKLNKETQALSDTLDQIDLIDIYMTFHPKAAEYTFFSRAHGTFSRIDHMVDYKSIPNKFKKMKTVSGIFSNHNAMRGKINYKKKKN